MLVFNIPCPQASSSCVRCMCFGISDNIIAWLRAQGSNPTLTRKPGYSAGLSVLRWNWDAEMKQHNVIEVATSNSYHTLDSCWFSISHALRHHLVVYDACALGFLITSSHGRVRAQGSNPTKVLIPSTSTHFVPRTFKIISHIGIVMISNIHLPDTSSNHARCICFGIFAYLIASPGTWVRSPLSLKKYRSININLLRLNFALSWVYT